MSHSISLYLLTPLPNLHSQSSSFSQFSLNFLALLYFSTFLFYFLSQLLTFSLSHYLFSIFTLHSLTPNSLYFHYILFPLSRFTFSLQFLTSFSLSISSLHFIHRRNHFTMALHLLTLHSLATFLFYFSHNFSLHFTLYFPTLHSNSVSIFT